MNCSIRPSTKTGIETPRLAPTIVATSVVELRRSAEMRPSGTPTDRGEQQRVDGQLDGRRAGARSSIVGHRPAVADGVARGRRASELPMYMHELDVDGLVEAVALVEGVADRIGGPLAQR